MTHKYILLNLPLETTAAKLCVLLLGFVLLAGLLYRPWTLILIFPTLTAC
jgi:hypothetical protein